MWYTLVRCLYGYNMFKILVSYSIIIVRFYSIFMYISNITWISCDFYNTYILLNMIDYVYANWCKYISCNIIIRKTSLIACM